MIEGDLECSDLFTSGWFGVSGHIAARSLIGESGSNCLLVAKSASVTFLHERGHSIEILQSLETEILCSQWNLVQAGSLSAKFECETPSELFLPDLIDEYKDLKVDDFLDLYDNNKPWRKTT